jgi:hypothetical protein
LLLLEARPPDTPAFNRTDYYRTALKTLGEPFFERRVLVNIEAEPTWEKKGRKAARFQDSSELRQALEDALRRYGVRAVIIDEAQHLMKVGTGAKLLDQLDWIKSMTNVTEVLHILLGTYDLPAQSGYPFCAVPMSAGTGLPRLPRDLAGPPQAGAARRRSGDADAPLDLIL